jgi:hypothetical protein
VPTSTTPAAAHDHGSCHKPRRAEALAAAQEAVERCQELAARDRDAYLPDLAIAVYNIAEALAHTGQHHEASRRAREAIDLSGELAHDHPDTSEAVLQEAEALLTSLSPSTTTGQGGDECFGVP